MAERLQKGEKILRGIAVSDGVCRGKILVLHRTHHIIARHGITAEEVAGETGRFEKALVQTRQEILEVQRKVVENLGAKEADIFEAHLLMLEDHALVGEVIRLIKEEKVNAEYAFHTLAERYAEALLAANDEYLRERAADMRDLTSRVLDNLLEVKDAFDLHHIAEPCILVSHDLSPSTTAQLNKKFVLGFATDIGGKTSHTAIMARSLGIPAVVGLQSVSQELDSGDYALLDGYSGTIIVNPTDQTLFEYGQLAKIRASLDEKLREIRNQPAVTLDGKSIHLSANIEDQNDIEAVIANGAEGVGLFRTEFLFINRNSLPTEEDQYKVYREVAAALKPNSIIIRTLDLGGDKFASHLQLAQEMNPFLGWRAIRFCLAQPELFRAQLRAILRASAEGNVKMMYPMISGLDELNQANAIVDKCKAELRAEGKPFDANMDIGAMIEIPSAALIANTLARRAKFFSIGSNDLIQYTLAADRTNERVSHLYEPTHPAILRLIKMIVDAAHQHGIWTGVCGEIAGDAYLTPLLIGLGVDELSAAPSVVPQVKYIIRRLKLSEAQALAEFALQCESPSEIYRRCQELARVTAPSLFEKQNVKVIILAAGYATRLYPLTLTQPKPLLPVAGKPMVEHVLDNLAPIDGIDRVYVVTNARFAGHFQKWSDHYRATKSKFAFTVVNDGSTDDTNKLGAIGDIHYVLKTQNVDDDLIIVAGDNLFSEKLADFGKFCREKNAPVLALYDVGNLEEIKKYNSISTDAAGRITFFEEKPQTPTSTLTGIALYYYPKSTISLIKQYIAEGNNPDQPGRLVQWLYPRTAVYTWRVPGLWFDIGSKETLEEANQIFAKFSKK